MNETKDKLIIVIIDEKKNKDEDEENSLKIPIGYSCWRKTKIRFDHLQRFLAERHIILRWWCSSDFFSLCARCSFALLWSMIWSIRIYFNEARSETMMIYCVFFFISIEFIFFDMRVSLISHLLVSLLFS